MVLSNDPADPVSGMTSGDISRMLDVDLKTVHRWVQAGRLSGRRTEGGHLRFHRPEVVRFMRRFGYVVPTSVGDELPRVIAVGFPPPRGRESAAHLTRAFEVESYASLFDAAIAAAYGHYEVVALDLRNLKTTVVDDFVRSMRSWPMTSTMAMIAVAATSRQRRGFVRHGGDIAVQAPGEVRAAVRWVTGGKANPPKAATTLLEFE